MDHTSSLDEQEAASRFLADPTVESYAACYRLLAPRILRFFRARGCDIPLAEDLAQEVMLSVWRNNSQLRDHTLFRPWLFRIARNTLLQHGRKLDLQVPVSELAAGMECVSTPERDPLAGAQFAQWMQSLSADEREAMVLRYVEGLEYHEIANMLETPIGTVQWRIFQSKRKLAARFGPAGR